MFHNWQDFVAVGLVLAALVYVTWRLVKLVRSRGSCGGCASCANKDAREPVESKPLVEIAPLSRPNAPVEKR